MSYVGGLEALLIVAVCEYGQKSKGYPNKDNDNPHPSHLLSQKVSSKQRATLALVTKLRAKVNIYISIYEWRVKFR